MGQIEVVEGDITQLRVDVIVNAANSALAGGGGVDGAIHRAAGPELLKACAALQGCATGQAKMTPAFKLPSKAVFHAVGPVWRGGQRGEAELLASCYRESMRLAERHGFKSIAFPAISCGVYRYPREEAVAIAVSEVRRELQSEDQTLERVIFCCFDSTLAELYRAALKAWGRPS